VIDGANTGVDYVYMHLRRPPLVRTGDRVFTGQKIGEVGETGRATGCHLHFEMWTAPGWYAGGRAFDPLPSLRPGSSTACLAEPADLTPRTEAMCVTTLEL